MKSFQIDASAIALRRFHRIRRCRSFDEAEVRLRDFGHEPARRFDEREGFLPFPDRQVKLFPPMAGIKALFTGQLVQQWPAVPPIETARSEMKTGRIPERRAHQPAKSGA